MMKCFPAIQRLAVVFILGIGLAMGAISAHAQPTMTDPSALPPLRIPDLPVGAHCFGLNPCTLVDPFGLRLRAAVLAVFRPEKGHERDFYAARIQLAPSVTLMQWAEFGVAIPMTLYAKDIGVTAIYEPLQPFGRVRLPLDGVLGGVATTAFVRVHIASGPFAGGLPPLAASGSRQTAVSDFMTQAIQSYRPQTQFEAGLALLKRIGPVAATGSIGAAVSTGRLEVYGGGELAYSLSIMALFIQGQGIGVPQCPPDEAKLNFCARGFRFGAGARFDWDLGGGGMMVATGSGAVEPGWEVGGQFGLDYDETTRRRHGDGNDAAHAWWDRRLEAMTRGWVAWKSAAAVWPDEGDAFRRAQPHWSRPFSDTLGGAAPPPSSPWLDSLLGDDASESPFPEQPAGPKSSQQAGRLASTPQVQKGKPSHHGPLRRSLFAMANARVAAQRQIGREPRFALPGSLDLMSDEELSRQHWQVVQEELRRIEQQRWRESPDLPPVSKALLNGLARVPYGMASGFFMGSPDGARQVAEIWNRLRPVPYTPEEQQLGETMEEIVSFAGEIAVTAGSGALVKAESASAELAMRAGARESARQAGRQALFEAAEQAALNVTEGAVTEAAELGGSRVSEFLANARAHLNPMNYRVCGVSCGGGGIEFKPPKLPAVTAATDSAVTAETDLGAVVEHEAPLVDGSVVPSRYKRPSGATTPAQRAAVQGKPCVDCGTVTPRQVADHKLPLVKEHYETGAIDKDRMRSLDAVQPQCPTCSNRQGAELSRYGREQRQLLEGKEP